jgi:hypothetical protein
MRLRFRTIILTVALLLTNILPASANFLDPFHWGNYNNGYGAYPANHAAAAHHYGTYRLIDDWLGYGYLRNQEGTLGHYPYRGWNWGGLGGGSNWKGGWDLGLFGWNWDWGWGANPGGIGWNHNWGGRIGWPQGGNGSQFYQPAYPGLMNPFLPIAPAYPAPIAQAPMMPPMQFAPQMQMPMGDPCCDPCQSCDPCMSMIQPQMPVPVTTFRPMVVDRGHWQRVWVPRPVTTMVPQTQYMMPQAPMMQMPISSGCDDCGGSMMQGSVMHGGMIPEMSADGGCCGSEGSGEIVVPGASAPVPQQTMMMSPGYSSQFSAYPQYTMNQFPMTQTVMSSWTPQTQWAPQTAYGLNVYMPQTAYMAPNNYMAQRQMRPRAMQRYARRMNAQYGTAMAYPQPVMQNYSAATMPMPQYGMQTAMSMPVAQGYSAYPATAFATPTYSAPMYSSPAYGSMPMQTAWSAAPMTSSTMMMPSSPTAMNPMMMNDMSVTGDIMGDHEMVAPTTAGVPIVPNSFRGNVPVMRANLARPVGSLAGNRYPQVVR